MLGSIRNVAVIKSYYKIELDFIKWNCPFCGIRMLPVDNLGLGIVLIISFQSITSKVALSMLEVNICKDVSFPLIATYILWHIC